jgi:oligopeptide/dipeptide ABC transporter ATP-binding protein
MLSVRDLTKVYPIRDGAGAGALTALSGVSLDLAAGETLGILGESGCGKSTLAKVLVQLERATSGSVQLDGIELTTLRGTALRQQRRRIQLVFQDPFSSLNPRSTVGDIIGSVLAVHGLADRSQRPARVAELLDSVGLDADFARRYPHQMSGGQRQRIGIARALAVQPQVLILDEPVSALDVSVRAEIMNLLARLRRELKLAYIFISHDVAMVRHLADRVAVMYLGRVVELGPWRTVIDRPAHPYTRALSAAVPVPDPTVRGDLAATVSGEVPDPADPPAGCTFHPRCPLAEDICWRDDPVLRRLADEPESDRLAACHVVTR